MRYSEKKEETEHSGRKIQLSVGLQEIELQVNTVCRLLSPRCLHNQKRSFSWQNSSTAVPNIAFKVTKYVHGEYDGLDTASESGLRSKVGRAVINNR